jgi:hypothetical protein
MPKLVKGPGPLGMALVAWDIWKRIPSRHRKALLKQATKQARKHGPRIAKQVVDARKAAEKRRKL